VSNINEETGNTY